MLRTLVFTVLCGTLIVPALANQTTQNSIEFVVIIPSFKNERFVEPNLNSICWQKSTNPYQIIYINDCSPDKTGELVDSYIQQNHLEHMITLINNPERLGSGIGNIYNTIHNFVDDHKVVVILDGDDLLPHNDVLMRLESIYKNQEVWMAYSKLKFYNPDNKSLIFRGFGQGIAGSRVNDRLYLNYATNKRSIREKCPWITALRTFKAALFKKIKKEDLYYEGKFMTVAWDHAFCIPMLEMCASRCSLGLSHCVFIDEVLYLYRMNSGSHDHLTKSALQWEIEHYIRRNLSPYKPIGKLFS